MGFKVSQSYAGNFYKAADLPTPKTVTIQAVSQVEMEGQQKLAVQFVGEQQQLLLNKTNAVTISQLYGDDTDTWRGQAVELFATQTDFGGRRVPCIRVRQPQQAPWDVQQQPAVQHLHQTQPQQPVQQQPAPSPPIDA